MIEKLRKVKADLRRVAGRISNREASVTEPAFHRDALGFEVRSDVRHGKTRWITVGPVDQPGTSILLAPPRPPTPGH